VAADNTKVRIALLELTISRIAAKRKAAHDLDHEQLFFLPEISLPG
jgi:hypothetical protein